MLTLLIITINTIIITHTWRVSIEQKREQSINQSNYYLSSIPINLKEFDLLDSIIQETFNRYEILNLAHKQNLYITEAIQSKIISDITKEIFYGLSDNVFDKLSLIYKKDHIEDIIVQKIQMIVLNYTIETNGNYTEEKNKGVI